MENNLNNKNKEEEIEKNNKVKKESTDFFHNINPLKRDSKKRLTTFNSRVYLQMKEEMSKKKKKQISLKDIKDKEIRDLYILLKKTNRERTKIDNADIFLF